MTIAKAHDRLFKLTLELPGVARALLRERLPPAIGAELADGDPRPLPYHLVNERLSEMRPDETFLIPLRGGASIFCVIAHKSTLDPDIGFHLLHHFDGIWQSLMAHYDPLPPIVPLVVYNGQTRWSLPRRFSDGLTAPLAAGLALDFPIQVFDLGVGDEMQLSAMPWLRGALRLLRHGVQSPGAEEAKGLLVGILSDLQGAPDSYLEAVRSYVLDRWEELTLQAFDEAMRAVMPDKEARVVSKAARQLLDEGRADGLREGLARGRAEGMAATLLRLLERRFGPLPEEVRERAATASVSQLERWIDRSVDASSLSEVFDEPEH
ncbi:MAG: Rpn family recombination-promoting nuclease/putative transposase [Myxococcales bacterium]|jgi:hypothetical protein